MVRTRTELAMYLAVLPRYRSTCIDILTASLGDRLTIYVSDAHLDPTVTTGIPSSLYLPVRMRRLLGGRVYLQHGHTNEAARSRSLVVDLNPRSLTTWRLLLQRRVMGRRTLVWGHLYPQAGSDSSTAFLRRLMRRLAHGTITYTYENRRRAIEDSPSAQVWVAPNAIYRESVIAPGPDGSDRRDVLYVGRLEPKKKVDLLVRGFARALRDEPSIRLRIVGSGSEEKSIRALVTALGIDHAVSFEGWVDSPARLRDYFATAFRSASPGFIGLGLTQSAGFGVPMIAARDEPHSPEVELADVGAVEWFESNDPVSLGAAIIVAYSGERPLPDEELSAWVRKRYSAEAMAEGLEAALVGRRWEES